MTQAPLIEVVGLRALNRDLNALTLAGSPFQKAMQQAGAEVAEPIAAMVRSTVPQVTGRLAGTVRVTAPRSGASVWMGSSSVRYAGWVDFGGNRRAPHDSSRDYISTGRYMFPAARALAGAAANDYSQKIAAVLEAYNWTNETSDPGGVHD